MNALIESLFPAHDVLSRYDVYGRHSGRVYRVRAAALSPAEQAEAAYWLDRVQRDFRAQTARW